MTLSTITDWLSARECIIMAIDGAKLENDGSVTAKGIGPIWLSSIPKMAPWVPIQLSNAKMAFA